MHAPASSPPEIGFREFVTLVAALMAMSALSVDMMLPALPAIGDSLHVAHANDRQWVISAYLLGFGVVAGLFSRIVIGRATENARLQQRLAEEERDRERIRERELLSRLGRDFGASLDRAAAKRASPSWQNGDFNYDNVIDANDYLLIDRSFAIQSGGSLSPELLADRESQFGPDYLTRLNVSIPEPSLLFTLGLPTFSLLRPRRRG